MNFQTIINVETLQDNLSHPEWVIVDCRFSLNDPSLGELEYLESHIPGSYYAHLDRDLSSLVIPGVTGRHPLPDIDTFLNLIGSWGVTNKTQVVVYDHSNGGIAARLWWLFRWLGHIRVAVLNGGWAEWKNRLLPIDSSIPAIRAGSFVPALQHSYIVDASKVNDIRSLSDWRLVDARAKDRFLGLVEPIDPVAGHIEGAINHPFTLNTDEKGIWRAPDDLRQALLESGITTEPSKTVFYCGSGVTACHDILAFKHAGLGNALLYPGSWSEWITR